VNIELEITLRCNANCPQCSRHCPVLDYADSDMSMNQIHIFAAQIIELDARVELLSIMGGEPLLHPNFMDVVQFLHERLVPKRVLRMQVATNDILPLPSEVLRLPHVRVLRSRPSTKRHRAQFVAPRDTGQETRYCQVPDTCGIAVNAFGVFPCGAGGAIARLFGYTRFAVDVLPQDIDVGFGDFRAVLCPLCQASAVTPLMLSTGGHLVSPLFAEAFGAVNGRAPVCRKVWYGQE